MTARSFDPLDIDTAIAFIERRFANDRTGYAILMFKPPGGGAPIHLGVALQQDDRWDLARRYVADHIENHDCYLSVANFVSAPTGKKGQNRTKEMVGCISALFCERDAAPLAPQLPPPTFTVETSDGRYQDYWHLDRPTDIATFEAYTRRIAQACGIGFEAVDAARVLRIPGTRNHKPAHHGEIVRVVASSETRYDLAAFDHLPALPATPPASSLPALAGTGQRVPPERLWQPALDRAGREGRNDSGLWLACQLRDNGYTEAEADAIGCSEYVPRVPRTTPDGVIEPYTDDEYRTSVGQAYGRAPRAPWTTSRAASQTDAEAGDAEAPTANGSPVFRARMRTDYGNAERLVDQHGPDIHYVFERGMWATWNRLRWQLDETGELERRAKRVVRNIYREARAAEDSDERAALGRHAASSEAAARLRAMIDLTRSEGGITVHTADFDRDPWLLNCQNGVVDLRTGNQRDHDRAELHMKIVPVAYDPAAPCPTFLRFLERIIPDADTRRFLQRFAGYSLTGNTREDAMAILYGGGRNGKTTLVEVLRDLLGDYGMQTPTETLMIKHDGAIPNDLARLQGARFVAASEGNEGQRLAEGTIKQLTGRDGISARFLNHEWFTFPPTFKVWFSTNHKPVIRGTDTAIWERIRLIPFTVRFYRADELTDDQSRHNADARTAGTLEPYPLMDLELPNKLRPELPGILNWLLEGCLDWQRNGLGTPAEVTQAVAAYREEMDTIGQWIADACIQGPQMTATAKQLYTSYVAWSEGNGERTASQNALGKSLTERGYTSKRMRDGVHWFGIGIVDAPRQGGFPPNTPPSDPPREPSVNLVNLREPYLDIGANREAYEGDPQIRFTKVHKGSQTFTAAATSEQKTESQEETDTLDTLDTFSPVSAQPVVSLPETVTETSTTTGEETRSTDSEVLWTWVGDVHAGRATGSPESVRVAGQRMGFVFDSFKPAAENARLLADHLDKVEGGER